MERLDRIGQRNLIFGTDADNNIRSVNVDEEGNIGVSPDSIEDIVDPLDSISRSLGCGRIFNATLTMADDNATVFTLEETLIKYAKIVVTGHNMLFGDSVSQLFEVEADGELELPKFDLSRLWFRNAGAGQNGTVTIIGVEE